MYPVPFIDKVHDEAHPVSYLLPYETKTFSQFWWPIQHIAPVQEANTKAALRMVVNDGRGLDLGLCVSEKIEGASLTITSTLYSLAWLHQITGQSGAQALLAEARASTSLHRPDRLTRHEPRWKLRPLQRLITFTLDPVHQKLHRLGHHRFVRLLHR